jgi:hypothetical protein
MRILDRLPISDEPATALVGSEAVTIKRFQIFAWVSLEASTPFPAILDTGHSHNFSITESQLVHWAGLRSGQLKLVGTTRLKGERLSQLQGEVRLHRNRPGTRDLAQGSFPLVLTEGFTLAPEGSSRLPLIGLRAIVSNRLVLRIDGRRRLVSLRSPGWFRAI